MRHKPISFFILLVLLLSKDDLFSQGSADTSGLVNQPEKNTIDYYYRAIGDNSHLYNGREYVSPVYRQDMDPYFKSAPMTRGDIHYDGFLYTNVFITYDILNDALITYRSDQRFRVELVKEKIGSFSILGHLFIRIVPDSMNAGVIDPGFYDLLYDGRLQVIARREKKIQESIVQNVANVQMVESERIYVRKEKKYYFINSQHSLLGLLKERKKDLKKFMHENKIRFKDNPENCIVLLARFYDQLKN